ncbi:MAG: hypothetical protein A4E65_01875 [Syntrophorhabdus sp. PtaU1.Bin153]|nr:MAG: hypothetical protein A4E65_01875 [Syntrophorhabdus sp. PtaU1.Bin153]
MTGITSLGAYIPTYRLNKEEIGRMWKAKGGAGEKAIAGYDEDAVTMAVTAAVDCAKKGKTANGLYFATTSAPYKEKQSAAIIAAAIDLDKTCRTAEFANSLRAGTSAMMAAMDTVASGSAEEVMVVASDCRIGAPKGRFEQLLGDGAAAFMIGSKDLIATIEGTYSITSDFTDVWRMQEDTFPQAAEARFVVEAGYVPTMKEAVSGLLTKYSLTPADFSKIVFPATDAREHADMAKALGFDKSHVQDPLFSQIGNTGAAAAMIMLVAAIEEANPGDRILFANYGDGCDAFIFRVVKGVLGFTMKDRMAEKVSIDYGTYLAWRGLVPTEPPAFPPRADPSFAARWRERSSVTTLKGFKCRKCGTPQIHTIAQGVRICIACQTKDEFDIYNFADKPAKLFTYAVDILQPTKNPPGVNGVIDFDGGGRLVCELTDCNIDKVKVGMPLEMTFRKMSQSKGTVNYFWKAKPILGANSPYRPSKRS